VAAGAVGLAAALAACGSDETASSGSATTRNGSGTSGGSDGAGAAAGSGGAGAAAGSSGAVLARTADIPEGGGKIFAEHGVVVTQPTKGQFKAFSSTCTHQGCAVTGITGGMITCPCHHSAFSTADGSVRKGPATRPLPARTISVSGDEIKLA
jgi:nitrite reductase/ring-hydroxylating ferredoxin subunit